MVYKTSSTSFAKHPITVEWRKYCCSNPDDLELYYNKFLEDTFGLYFKFERFDATKAAKSDFYEFNIIDEKKFYLSKIKYGI
jgi:hypothetical protein